jgi:hypothetical protein
METIRIVTLVAESLGLITVSPFLGSLVGSLPRGIFWRRPVGVDVGVITTTTMVTAVLRVLIPVLVILGLKHGRVGGGVMALRISNRFRADCGAFVGAVHVTDKKFDLLLRKLFGLRWLRAVILQMIPRPWYLMQGWMLDFRRSNSRSMTSLSPFEMEARAL